MVVYFTTVIIVSLSRQVDQQTAKEAAICPADPKQTRVLLKVLFPDFQMPHAVPLPFKGSTTLVVHVCVGHCLDPVCVTALYLGHQVALRHSSIVSPN